MAYLAEELQETLRGIIHAQKLWEKRKQVARDYPKIRSLMGNARYTVVLGREEIFNRVYAEERDCHTEKVGCDKEPVIAGR